MRNSERLGLEQEPKSNDSNQVFDPIPVQQLTENNNKSELSYFNPTEMIDLPTKGRFYSKEHPLYNVESIEIRYMGARDVEILNSKTLLQKGLALDKMLQGLLIDKSIKVDDLFIPDKNALILAARITGFDAEYNTRVICPVCGEKSNHSFDLNAVKAKEVDEKVELMPDGSFELALPLSKAKVVCKLLTGADEKELQLMSNKKKKHKLPEQPLMDQLKQIIVSVNNDTDKEVVNKFIDNILARDSKFIRDEYARITPNIDLKQMFECSVCSSESEINIPLTADFFWP